MARYTVSVTATIESSSLIEGRCDAETLVELLKNEFPYITYSVELRESGVSNALFEDSTGDGPATFH
jgi:hypothetical protein